MKKKLLMIAWCSVSVLLFGAVAVSTVDKLVIEPRTISSWGELVDSYLFSRISLPPLPFAYADALARMKIGDWSFLADRWQCKQSGGTYYVAEKSKLAKLKLPLHILVYEDLQRGEIVVLSSTDGEKYQGEALFKAPEFMPYETDLPLNRYVLDELAPRRVVFDAILKPESEAWSDLVLLRDSAVATALLLDGGEMMAMMSVPAEHTNDLWLGMEGAELSVFAPEGFTNRVEIYSCSDLVSNVWNVAVQNLLPVNTNPAVWNSSLSGDRGFFRTGNMDIDSDSDGINDAREQIVYKTDPSAADTDGDGMPDGWEITRGLKATSGVGADGASGDFDGDGLGNLLEYETGTEPFYFDQVRSVAPSSMMIQYRSTEVHQSKFGWEDFDTNAPVQIFTTKTEQYEKHVGGIYDDISYNVSSEDITSLNYS